MSGGFDDKLSFYKTSYEIKIIKIQSWFRGILLRLKTMPLIMYKIRKYICSSSFEFSTDNKDGRINSCVDEENIIKLLVKKFGVNIKVAKIRMIYLYLIICMDGFQ